MWLIGEVWFQRVWQLASRWVLRRRSLPIRATSRQKSATDFKRISRVSFQETLVLSISLALNPIAGGLGASLSGYNPLLLSLATGIFSYGTIEAEQRLAGSYLSKRFGYPRPTDCGCRADLHRYL